MPTCWNCGKEVAGGATFCSNCGKQLTGTKGPSASGTSAYAAPSGDPRFEEMVRKVNSIHMLSIATVILMVVFLVLLFVP